jgi:NAD(P)-dependent dehydrogenase (short-subunit alcohol dehydrogenase family)
MILRHPATAIRPSVIRISTINHQPSTINHFPLSSRSPPVSSSGRLDGRNCLVVGGTSGIGLAAVRRFREEGARVVVSGRESDAPETAEAILVDVGEVGFERSLFDEAVSRLGGRLDILVHVAGISGRRFGDGPLHECSDEAWERVLDTNARSVFLTNREAVRRMLDQPLDDVGLRGSIVNIGSVLSDSPSPELFATIAYAASKGAIHALTRSAASRYARDRIRFNLLAPALIDSPMSARAAHDPGIRAYLASKQPLTGGPGSVADVAEAALYLCEPASRFVTGVVLTVDGGWSISDGQLPAGEIR